MKKNTNGWVWGKEVLTKKCLKCDKEFTAFTEEQIRWQIKIHNMHKHKEKIKK